MVSGRVGCLGRSSGRALLWALGREPSPPARAPLGPSQPTAGPVSTGRAAVDTVSQECVRGALRLPRGRRRLCVPWAGPSAWPRAPRSATSVCPLGRAVRLAPRAQRAALVGAHEHMLSACPVGRRGRRVLVGRMAVRMCRTAPAGPGAAGAGVPRGLWPPRPSPTGLSSKSLTGADAAQCACAASLCQARRTERCCARPPKAGRGSELASGER